MPDRAVVAISEDRQWLVTCEDCIRAAGYEPPSREGEAQDA